MKKKSVFFLFLLLTGYFFNGQVVEIQKLASGKLISSNRLYDNERDDVYGYIYFYQKDKISKEEDLIEYVLLDKNLNKICSGEFTDDKVETMWKSFIKRIFYTSFSNGTIIIQIRENSSIYDLKSKYRLLNIQENKLSESFTLDRDLSKNYNSTKDYKKTIVSGYTSIPGGFLIVSPLYNNDEAGRLKNNPSSKLLKLNTDPKKLQLLNENFDPVWSYDYNQNATKNNYEDLFYAYPSYINEKNTLILNKSLEGKENEKEQKQGKLYGSFIFLNSKNGSFIRELDPFRFGIKSSETNKKEIYCQKVFVDDKNDKVNFLLTLANTKDKENTLDQRTILGFSNAEYSISTGKELKRNYFTWEQLSSYLNIDENGYIKEKGEPNSFLYLHDILMKSNGNLILIMEQYKPLATTTLILANIPGGAKINNLMFVELDKEMKPIHFNKIDKEIKTIRVGYKLYGEGINSINGFDYSGYQDMGKDSYCFFYYNKQKVENENEKENPLVEKKKQWVLGIVSYADGKFSEQKLPLKSEDGSDLYITPAKKGYVMIYETFKDKDKSPEIRLEKIN